MFGTSSASLSRPLNYNASIKSPRHNPNHKIRTLPIGFGPNYPAYTPNQSKRWPSTLPNSPGSSRSSKNRTKSDNDSMEGSYHAISSGRRISVPLPITSTSSRASKEAKNRDIINVKAKAQLTRRLTTTSINFNQQRDIGKSSMTKSNLSLSEKIRSSIDHSWKRKSDSKNDALLEGESLAVAKTRYSLEHKPEKKKLGNRRFSLGMGDSFKVRDRKSRGSKGSKSSEEGVTSGRETTCIMEGEDDTVEDLKPHQRKKKTLFRNVRSFFQ